MRRIHQVWGCIVILCAISAHSSANYQPHITEIHRDIHKNWLAVPQEFTCAIEWDVLLQEDGRWLAADPHPFTQFQVIAYRDNEVIDTKTIASSEPYSVSFENLQPGVKYQFEVCGVSQNADSVYSKLAEIMTGRLSAAGEKAGENWLERLHKLPLISGRTPLTLIGNEIFYDNSTRAGQLAFWIIWWFFLLSLFFITQCWRYMSISRIFPQDKKLYIGHGYDAVYDHTISKDFKSILEEWKNLILNTQQDIRGKLLTGSDACDNLQEVGVNYWQEKGASKIEDLISRISRYAQFATARVFHAGMQSHETNGFQWLKVNVGIEHAIENRASSEIDRLRRKSFIDWFWNLGTFAPMVGLFGTATGISHAFSKLGNLSPDTAQMQMVQQLAGGIYEALWTTIEGLSVGIFLMFVYHYYQNKLNWIYSKWEETYVDMTSKLHNR
jgi:biopolymer transport protein ExbB/TolQ